MKLLIASDIHGSAYWCDRLLEAIRKEQPTQILLLGDLLYHGPRNNLPDDYNPKAVAACLNNLATTGKLLCVRGNCEAEVDQMVLNFPVMADYIQLVDEDGRIIFATHGHLTNPDTLPTLPAGSIFVYGHTHIKQNTDIQRSTGEVIHCFNPGSVGLPKDGTHSFGIYENGEFRHIVLSETNQISTYIDDCGVERSVAWAPTNASQEFQKLTNIIWRLRQPDGCPWDKVQTHESIAKNMIEEAYEAVDCIEQRDTKHLCEELGDVLMQIMLHAQIAADEEEYTIRDVIDGLNQKLIRRHPHVFGEQHASNEDDVLAIWDSVKLTEEDNHKKKEGLLGSVPSMLPALMQAQKISRKAASVGFDWSDTKSVWAKVAEEYQEFEEEQPRTPEREIEFGDLLFALVNVARKEHIDAETALRASSRKFRKRWAFMEDYAQRQHKKIEEYTTDELEKLWKMAKKNIR